MSRKPEKKVTVTWLLQGLVTSAVLAAILTVGTTFLTDQPPYIIFLTFLTAGIVLSAVHTFYRYRSWSFEIREDHVYLEHGVLVKVYTMVPFVRIQHVDTQRNILDRVLGLSTVIIYTAGSRGADVSIPGLKPGSAEELQEKLRHKAIESDDRDGV